MTRIKDIENHIYGYLAASVITLFCSAGAILIVVLSWLSGTAESTSPYIAASGAITLLVQCYMLGKTAGPVESFFRGAWPVSSLGHGRMQCNSGAATFLALLQARYRFRLLRERDNVG